MTRIWRTYLALVLALILGLTSYSLAMARGMTSPSGQITLCTGTGPVIVDVDAEGQPVERPRYCPDFALHLLSGVVPPETDVRPVQVWAESHVCRVVGLTPRSPGIAASARGPPCTI